MNAKKILSVVDNLAGIVATFRNVPLPQAQAIAALAETVGRLIPDRAKNDPAGVQFDADADGIADVVDPDHGTVAAVTDEMIRAAEPFIDEWEAANSPEFANMEFPYAKVYLAMYNARPKTL
jgi:hypothetical protein